MEYYADGGRFQVSEIRFTYDPTLPVNERVVEVYVGDSPLDETKTYKVAMGQFLADGGSGHWVLATGQNYEDLGILLADSVINYLQEFSPVSPVTDGRITRID
jgi:5'-nucleotidase/UDP-sugar diphosphatase